MSDGYIYAGIEHYYENEKRADSKVRFLKIAGIVLTCFIIIDALLYLIILPCLSSPKINFSGNKSLSADELLIQCEFDNSMSWFAFDTATFASRLLSNSVVENVIVEKKFPDQVAVTITERVPVACSLVNVGDKTVPVQIDKNGVLFNVGSKLPTSSLPLLTGLDFSSISNGMSVPTMYKSLLEQISQIWQSNVGYFSALSEIRVVPNETGGYELVLYPLTSRVKILTDRTLNEETMQYVMVVLDVMDNIENDITEIDMRYGSVSYIKDTSREDFSIE